MSLLFYLMGKELSCELPRVQTGLAYHLHTSKLTVKILKFGTPQTIAIIVLKIEKFDVTLH